MNDMWRNFHVIHYVTIKNKVEKTIMRTIDYVVYDRAHDLYVMCWTENNTILLTSIIDGVETYNNRMHAISMVERIKYSNCKFLIAETEAEISDPDLVAGQLVVETKFVSFS